jgi:hypothetical protein
MKVYSNLVLIFPSCFSEKTAKRKRMLVTQDDGATKVVRKRDVRGYTCSRCGTTDATRWRKTHDSVQCKLDYTRL